MDHLELLALLLLPVVVDVGFESAAASVSGSDDDDEGCGSGGEVDSAERRLNVISRPFPDPLALINKESLPPAPVAPDLQSWVTHIKN